MLEVGFQASGTLTICGERLVKGSPVITISVIAQGSIGAGSRTGTNYGDINFVPAPGGYRGIEVGKTNPPSGLFGTLRGQDDFTFNLETKQVGWGGLNVYLEGGYRRGNWSTGLTSGPWRLF